MLNRILAVPSGRSGRRAALGLAVLVVTLGACKSILDVKNPNSIVEDDLVNPASATAQANGLGHSVTRGLNNLLPPYSDATDEVQYVGSRDAYDQLDRGFIAQPSNEFVDAAWYRITEARFMADAVIPRLEGFDKAGRLSDGTDLIRAYLYGAVIYAAMPDMMDDFVIAKVDVNGRKVATPSVGRANMTVMYDSAIAFTTRALARPEIATDRDLRARALAIRARAKFAKSIHAKTPVGPWVAGPSVSSLVADNGYVKDANDALGVDNSDWRFALKPNVNNVGFSNLGNDLNNRLELRAGDAYVVPNATGKRVQSIRLRDPIDGILDPVLTRAINTCCVEAVGNFVPTTVVSAREMHLLLAEAALQAGNTVGFQTAINNLRAYDGLTPWTPLSSVSALDILMHSRRVNLFLQGKRLRDMYRFGYKDPQWQSISTAFRFSGCMLVIPIAESGPNPNVKPPNCQQ